MRKKSSPTRFKGRLFLIGGAADRCVDSFVALAGGEHANVLLVPHATEDAQENSTELSQRMLAAGCGKISTIMPGQTFNIADGTTAIYMLGGDQSRLVELLGARGKTRIRAFLKGGGLVAGTSAGAACIGKTMITGGMGDKKLVSGALTTAKGLGLANDLIVDTHFTQRYRFNRLMYAVTLGKFTGIGLDEDTAAIIDGRGSVEIVGAGHVSFFRRGKTRVKKTEAGTNAGIENINVSSLPEGFAASLG